MEVELTIRKEEEWDQGKEGRRLHLARQRGAQTLKWIPPGNVTREPIQNGSVPKGLCRIATVRIDGIHAGEQTMGGGYRHVAHLAYRIGIEHSEEVQEISDEHRGHDECDGQKRPGGPPCQPCVGVLTPRSPSVFCSGRGLRNIQTGRQLTYFLPRAGYLVGPSDPVENIYRSQPGSHPSIGWPWSRQHRVMQGNQGLRQAESAGPASLP